MSDEDAPLPAGLDRYVALARRAEGGHLQLGPCGYALYCGDSLVIGGEDCDEVEAACLAAGLPLIAAAASTPPLCAGSLRWCRSPRWTCRSARCRGDRCLPAHPSTRSTSVSPLQWGPLSFAPLAVVAALCRLVGAAVLNLPAAGAGLAGEEEG